MQTESIFTDLTVISSMQTPVLKPCCEWYMDDKSYDIMDADGFHRENKYASVFWNFTPVSKEYYNTRRDYCTVVSYGVYGHLQPFPIQPGDKYVWRNFKDHPLVKMILTVISTKK